MERMLTVRILTPGGTEFEARAQSVILPGADGSFGVMYGHAEMIAALAEGKAVLKSAEGRTERSIGGGIAHIKDNTVTVFTDKAAS